ncbi:hypothetical protein Sango_0260200 [Sesamum angolense]|uniref:Uncharacterized protein n=1 Tax=Sesamum angolense TaxID=2727404 RepID=A0AAE2C7F9_9LAMI|nr:hypothetical protein Sango_0260200 [Sesamum angolense]
MESATSWAEVEDVGKQTERLGQQIDELKRRGELVTQNKNSPFANKILTEVVDPSLRLPDLQHTLAGKVQEWFTSLPNGTIESYTKLIQKFMFHFASKRKARSFSQGPPADVEQLMQLAQKYIDEEEMDTMKDGEWTNKGSRDKGRDSCRERKSRFEREGEALYVPRRSYRKRLRKRKEEIKHGPQAKLVKQKKRLFGMEHNKIIEEEVNKLLKARYVAEVQYTKWLSNVMVVPKAVGKWGMCTDFADLNKAYPIKHYLPKASQPNVQGAQWENHRGVCGSYADKKQRGERAPSSSISRFKVMRSQSTEIEATIMQMGSPKTTNDVQKLTGKVALLAHFISRPADNILLFFKTLRKVKDFQWRIECKQALNNLEQYLTTPPLLTNPKVAETLYLYLEVFEDVVSSALVREKGRTFESSLSLKQNVARCREEVHPDREIRFGASNNSKEAPTLFPIT